MRAHPETHYQATAPVPLDDRRWPTRRLTRAPLWMSTDLRDGNQALFEPMGVERKLTLFKTLVAIGFREIEVGFPSASQTEWDFVRLLIEGNHIPPHVTIEVLTPARAPLIERTMSSLTGVKRAIVHLYNAASPFFRQVVFRDTDDGVIDMAVRCARLIREQAQALIGSEIRFQYSPEHFTSTELEFSRRLCDAVTDEWQATAEHPVIINLPATVECASPNVFADQIEWMDRHLARRDGVCLSVHPHNDRGTAVAAAELALLAGAERVEGCLFGNGERSGNVDLVTLALNFYAQGITPDLDLSDLPAIARTAQECTGLEVPPRHPYAGDLVFTSFSGSHQDAIHKGFAVQDPDGPWRVPYLPIDPRDVGRRYDSIIRINSQSGKGGVAYLFERDFGIRLPRRFQIEFAGHVKALSEHQGEVVGSDLWKLLEREYLHHDAPIHITDFAWTVEHGHETLHARAEVHGTAMTWSGRGNGPIAALVDALPFEVRILDFSENALGEGADARAIAFVELAIGGEVVFGVGVDTHITRASLEAVMSAVNRALIRAPSVFGMDTSTGRTAG